MAKYSIDFKIQAEKRVVEDGVSSAQVSRELDINVNTLREWVQRYREDTEEPFVGSGNQRKEEKHIKELEKRVRDLEEENELLKKCGTHLCTEPKEMRFRFMYHHSKEFRIEKMAEFLKVTQAGYYVWLKRLNSMEENYKQELREKGRNE